MIFSHDTERSLTSVVDLVNTSRERSRTELLPDANALAEYLRSHLFSDVNVVVPADVEAVHRVRRELSDVFAADDASAAAGLLNALLATAATRPRLTDHDHHGWHLHYYSPEASVAEHLAVDAGMALAQVVAAGEFDRLRVCAAPGCSHVLVDLSRNRSKRYCDARTCGNRLHVAAYRERQRAGAADAAS